MINRLPKSFWLPTANGGHDRQPNGHAATPNWSQRISDGAERCIGDHPIASLGLAFLAGLLVGGVLKR
jgi:hypothetical protein